MDRHQRLVDPEGTLIDVQTIVFICQGKPLLIRLDAHFHTFLRFMDIRAIKGARIAAGDDLILAVDDGNIHPRYFVEALQYIFDPQGVHTVLRFLGCFSYHTTGSEKLQGYFAIFSEILLIFGFFLWINRSRKKKSVL
jgi:hypothetical protein